MSKRAIPGTNGAYAVADHPYSKIERTLYDADGTRLGVVCIFAKRSIYPYRIVRATNTSDVLGSNLAAAVETLRERNAKA